MPSASWTTARPLPASGRDVKTSSQVSRCWLEVEVLRRLLLEPEPVVLGRLLEELRRLLEHVLARARRRRPTSASRRRARRRLGGRRRLVLGLVRARPGASGLDGCRRLGGGAGVDSGAVCRSSSAAALGLAAGAASAGARRSCRSGGRRLVRRRSRARSAASAGSAPASSGATGSRRARAEGLVLEAGDLARVGAVPALELEVLVDRVVEQSHGHQTLAGRPSYSRVEPPRAPCGSCPRAWPGRAPRRRRRRARACRRPDPGRAATPKLAVTLSVAWPSTSGQLERLDRRAHALGRGGTAPSRSVPGRTTASSSPP